jgi:uncharacterized protein (DUF1330 family)
MAAYLVVQLRITREEAWPEYRRQVSELIAKHGGKSIVGGGTVEVLEGSSYDGRRIRITEFPSMEAIHAFWDSPDYTRIKKLREGAGIVDVWAIPGV